eukprot:jgi/Bigna1/136019/aug1.32_g10727
MLPAATTVFDLAVSAVALVEMLLAGWALASHGACSMTKKSNFLWLSVIISTCFIIIVQGFPRGYFSIPWRVWLVFFVIAGCSIYITALYYVKSVAESLYLTMTWTEGFPKHAEIAFTVALWALITAFVSGGVAMLVTNEIRWNGYILFPVVVLTHLWFTPYMMYVILALHRKISEHVHTLRDNFYGYSVDTPIKMTTISDSQDTNGLSGQTKTAGQNNPITPAGGSSERKLMNVSNKELASPKSASSYRKSLRSSNTGGGHISNSVQKKSSNRKETAPHYQTARAHELKKFQTAKMKIRIIFVVWTLCGIIVPVLAAINAIVLSQSEMTVTEDLEKNFAEGEFNAIIVLVEILGPLFNGLVVWNFGGPWRCR